MATSKLTAVVQTKGAKKSADDLKRFSKGANTAEKSNKGLASSFKGLVAPIAAVVSVSAGLSKLVSVSRQFDILNAQLITSTGSAKGAALAFRELEEFAANTPFQLEQSVNAFTKLVNLGLTPSERALTSYGDTASAMGKDLTQLIEAVADASTGEFERLKEFGIKAKSQGDNVSFTFRGVTQTVRKNSTEIEEYLTALGENNFSGAMVARMDTLDGALSNLGDQWDSVFRTISQQGTGSVIEEAVRKATDALGELEDRIASGQLAAAITANVGRFESWGKDVAFTLDVVNDLFSEFSKDIGLESESLGEFLTKPFSEMPENIRAFIQLMTVELAVFVDKTAAYGKEILENIKFWEDESFNLEKRLEVIDDARLSSISSILNERKEALASFNEQSKSASDLLAKYNELNKGRVKTDLSQFAVGSVEGGVGQDTGAGERLKNEKKAAQDKLAVFMALNDSELEEVSRREEQRLSIIDSFREQGLSSDEEYQAARNEIELSAANDRIDIAKKESDEKIAAAERERAARVGAALSVLSDLQTIGGKESKTAKRAAKATALIKTYEAANSAYASLAGIPVVGPVLGAAAAGLAITAGLANVRAIDAAREQGGQFNANQNILVGERGPEVVNFGQSGRVSNNMQMDQQPNVSLVVIDQSDGKKEFDESRDDEGRIVLLIRNTVSGDISQPNSAISKSLASSTSARRIGR